MRLSAALAVPLLFLLILAGCGGTKGVAKKPKPSAPKATKPAKKSASSSPPKAETKSSGGVPSAVETRPAASTPGPKESSPPAGDPAKTPSEPSATTFDPTLALPVAELIRKCADPKALAELRNGDVKLRGKVKKLTSGASDPAQWHLYLTDHRDSSIEFSCKLTDKEPWLKVVPGQAVVLQGKLDTIFALSLDDASIVAVGENPLPQISADELAAEAAADRKAANRKYAHKWLLCTGIVQKTDEKELAALQVKGELKVNFANAWAPDLLKELSAGQSTVLLVQCEFRPDGQPVILSHALPRPTMAATEAAVGLVRYDPPADELQPQVARPRPVTPAAKGTFDVATLKKKFEEDEFAEKYSKQWVTVEGFVRSGEYGRGKDRVTLQTDPKDPDEKEGIACLFSTPEALRLMPGQRLKLKGQVPNLLAAFLPNPVLQDCEIVDAGEQRVKSLTAAELAAEAKAEEDKPRSDKEWLICTGTFGGFDRYGDVVVRDKDGATVSCGMSLDASELFEAYFEDDPIRILGFRDRKGDSAKAKLDYCYPLKP
jgi:hypothetical protein